MMAPLGIVIVDYKNTLETIRFVREEISKLTLSYKVVIVNNEANDETNKEFESKLDAKVVENGCSEKDQKSDIFVLSSNDNLGFAKGNNLGARFLIDNFQCDYLLFSNNDIIIKDGSIALRLIDKIQSDNNIGLIGPEVVGLDGVRQSPEPYIPMIDRYVLMYLLTPFISKKHKIQRFHLDYAAKAAEGYHYRVMGSFFMMPSKIFEEIGMMDTNTFLYAEEMILAERLHSVGKKVYFYPDLSVIHAHGVTTKKHLGKKRISNIQAESEKYYYVHYRGLKPWLANLYMCIYNIIQKIK